MPRAAFLKSAERGFEAASKQNARRDAERRQHRVAKTEVPAWNFGLLNEPDPQPDSGRCEERPPAAKREADNETETEQDRDGHGLRIGSRSPPPERAKRDARSA